ncbi:GlxA family transcriptional regulator [Paucibacter soli]|uniref:GlxA family transcriptional regulator n=1 Tax=Paucibacter soli TaxID=3133433 RepID=UPI0030A90F06
MPNRLPTTLGLLLFEGCMPAGLFAVADLVAAANLRAGRELLRLRWLSLDGLPVASAHGLALPAEAALAELACDALLLPGLWVISEPGLRAALQAQAPLVQALRGLPARCQLWSYCAGVPLLAASGRLNGQPATATWWMAAPLQSLFPKVQWRFDAPLVSAARCVTAAGASGYLPLMLAQLASRMEPAALREVQEVLMLPQPRVRHAAFASVELLALQQPWLRELLLKAQQIPATALTLDVAAAALARSPRSLCRHVRAATGLPAARWLRLVKLRQAGEQLMRGGQPVKTIAEQLGFSSEGALHRMFKQATGMTPQAYRRAYAEHAAA